MSSEHRILAVDSSAGGAGLVLVSSGHATVSHLAARDGLPPRTEDLAAAASILLAGAGIGAADVTLLGAVVGPGSYTGLRSGLAFVRGLAFADSIPVVAVGSLELLAWRSAAVGQTVQVLAPIGSGRWAEAKYRRTDDDVEEDSPLRCLDAASVADLFGDVRVAIVSEELPEAFRHAAQRSSVALLVPSGDALLSLGRIVECRGERGLTSPAEDVMPVYAGLSAVRPDRSRVGVHGAPE